MATVEVSGLDSEVVRLIERRAVENNRDVESEIRRILAESAEGGADMPERMRAFRALSRRFREETRGTRQTPSEILIRRDREGER